MPYSQSDIDELRAKIKSFAGVRSTTFSDQSTTFSLEDALKTLEIMEREVNGGGSRTRYASTSKGIGPRPSTW